MDGQHLHVEPHGRFHGPRHRVRNVVKLEIAKHRRAGGAKPPNDVGSSRGKEFLADFQGADGGRELGRQFDGALWRRHIQRHHD